MLLLVFFNWIVLNCYFVLMEYFWHFRKYASLLFCKEINAISCMSFKNKSMVIIRGNKLVMISFYHLTRNNILMSLDVIHWLILMLESTFINFQNVKIFLNSFRAYLLCKSFHRPLPWSQTCRYIYRSYPSGRGCRCACMEHSGRSQTAADTHPGLSSSWPFLHQRGQRLCWSAAAHILAWSGVRRGGQWGERQ